MDEASFNEKTLIKIVKALMALVSVVLILMVSFGGMLIIGPARVMAFLVPTENKIEAVKIEENIWKAPDLNSIPDTEEGKQVRFGRELITHTAEYLGPSGSIMTTSNGMNCQNCHLDAGTKPFGNNYSAVASTYPKFRARSGREETIENRVNDCFERSLNGKPLKEDSREMQAIVAYFKWLGTDVQKGESPEGSGLADLEFLETPADPLKGKVLYKEKCVVCHGKNGEGLKNTESKSWTYPPLWGEQSYNDGAGLYRLSRFAGYIKSNMPLGSTYKEPILTSEEAWHIAAYVNSMPRPKKDLKNDWPDISKKPVDHPFGPFADGFDTVQHKFGPFKPIQDKRKELNKIR